MVEKNLPKRKPNRLENYNYSENGAYFITICTQNRKKCLSKIIVGTGVLDCPKIQLYKKGIVADKYIHQLNQHYKNVSVDKYIIMPDHIHLLLSVNNVNENGQSRTPVPTDNNSKTDNRNSTVASFVSTFKRFCNKEYDENIWQERYYDHIIRNQNDYNEVWEYIDHNPKKWIIKNITQDG